MTTVHGIELPTPSYKHWLTTLEGKLYLSNISAKSRCKQLGYRYEDISVEDMRAIVEAQDYECVFCAYDLYRQCSLDHIKPLSQGGSHTLDNIQFTCLFCNYSKRDYPKPFRMHAYGYGTKVNRW